MNLLFSLFILTFIHMVWAGESGHDFNLALSLEQDESQYDVTIEELSNDACQLSWEYPLASQELIDGFRVHVQTAEGEFGDQVAQRFFEYDPEVRQIPCTDLSIETLGNYTTWLVAYKGDIQSNDSNALVLSVIYRAELPTPQKYILTVQPVAGE